MNTPDTQPRRKRVDGVANLSWTEILSYGSGSMGTAMSWGMVSAFLLVYYTDVALLPVAAVGTLILVTRVIDAMFDPVIGLLVDHTRTRWGKARPYLLFASVPFGILSVLVFIVPDTTTTWQLVYAYVTFGLLGILYGLLYVPYAALQPLLTTNRKQMLTLSSVRAMGTSVASIFLYILAVPVITFFGGGQSGYTGAAIFFSIVTVILFLITFFNCRERTNAEAATDKSPVKLAVVRAFKNIVWKIAMIFEILIFIRLGMMVSAMAFYAKLVLGSQATLSILLPTLSVSILLGGLIASPFLQMFGRKRGTILALLSTMIAYSFVPIFGYTTLGFSIILFLGSIGFGIQATFAFSMIAESVEVQEDLFGFRDAGLLTSVASFNQKVGFALGSACFAWTLAWANYSPTSPSTEAIPVLIWLFCLVPVVFAAIQIMVLYWYRPDSEDGYLPAAG